MRLEGKWGQKGNGARLLKYQEGRGDKDRLPEFHLAHVDTFFTGHEMMKADGVSTFLSLAPKGPSKNSDSLTLRTGIKVNGIGN
jgi:hypothetical protein